MFRDPPGPGWSLPLQPNLAASLDAKTSEFDDALRHVLEVAPGERQLLPDFGCRVQLMNRIESSAELSIAAALIEEALEAWLPECGVRRVEVLSVRVFDDGVDSDAAPGMLRLGVWRPEYAEVDIAWFGPISTEGQKVV